MILTLITTWVLSVLVDHTPPDVESLPKSSFRFTCPAYYAGISEPNATLDLKIRLVNEGSRAIEHPVFTTSCGCTVVSRVDLVPPKSSRLILVTVKTPPKEGLDQILVVATSKDGEMAACTKLLVFSGGANSIVACPESFETHFNASKNIHQVEIIGPKLAIRDISKVSSGKGVSLVRIGEDKAVPYCPNLLTKEIRFTILSGPQDSSELEVRALGKTLVIPIKIIDDKEHAFIPDLVYFPKGGVSVDVLTESNQEYDYVYDQKFLQVDLYSSRTPGWQRMVLSKKNGLPEGYSGKVIIVDKLGREVDHLNIISEK